MKKKKLTKKEKQANKRIYKVIKKAHETSDKPISYIVFKHRVMARMSSDGLDVKAAVKKELNTLTFTSAAQRSRNNLIDSIKEDFPEEYKKLRYLSRNKEGKFIPIRENLTWDTEENYYKFTAFTSVEYYIDVTNSPKEVVIREK